jgi:molybdenum cofactor guanylyltransferase
VTAIFPQQMLAAKVARMPDYAYSPTMRSADSSLSPLPCTAAILAGGAAKRMGGATKALLDVGGQTILDTLVATLSGRFTEILLVAKEPMAFQAMQPGAPWRLVLDACPERSSLTGIRTALAHARTEHVFITACDTPLLRPALLTALLDHLRAEDDVVLPVKPDGYFEPLCAIYSRRCLPHIEAQLAREDYKIIRFFDQVRVSPLPLEMLLQADPDLLTFRNANTPEDLELLRQSAQALLPTQEALCPPVQEDS